ncbi:MAG: lipase family alpha/beta hydrolase [Rubripirellula sp.]
MNMRPWLSGLCLLTFSFPHAAIAQVTDIEITHPDSNHIELLIPADNGIVQWTDVATSLAGALKLDAPSVQKMLPNGQMNLHSDAVLLVLMGINLAAGDSISFGLVRDSQNRSSLKVKCDRRMFGAPVKRLPAREVAGISVDDDWQQRTDDRPLLICIHGLQSHAEAFDDFRDFMRSNGYATASVSYDFEQSIRQSATQVSNVVNQYFANSKSPSKFALVGHSMGGLVAREWTENPGLDNTRVSMLFTLGTPHEGSNWASMPPLLDLFSSGDFDANDLVDVILHQPSAHGLKDLIPGSEFLQKLESRPRREDVAYTNIVGTFSPFDDESTRQLITALRQLDQDGSLVRLVKPRIAPLLDSFEELSDGQGDGVVAVKRALIDKDLDSAIRLKVSHFQMVRAMEQTPHPVWNAVLDRLRVHHK